MNSRTCIHKGDFVHVKVNDRSGGVGQERMKNRAGYQNNFHTVPLGLC